MKSMESYVVIGLDIFGLQCATQLYEQGKNVLAIDKNEQKVNENANKVSRAIIADARNREVLKQLGVDKYDCAIVTAISDLGTAVLVTMNLKALGIKEIICRANNATDKEVLETVGATNVIILETLAADRLCRRLSQPNVLDYIEVSDKFGIIELEMPESWINKSIVELNVRAKYGINIIAIKRDNEVNVAFTAGYVMKKDDIIVILGDNKSLEKVQAIN